MMVLRLVQLLLLLMAGWFLGSLVLVVLLLTILLQRWQHLAHEVQDRFFLLAPAPS